MKFSSLPLWLFLLPVGFAACAPSHGPKTDAQAPGIAARVTNLEARAGLLSFYVDAKAGQILLELPPNDTRGLMQELIYVEGLRRGMGSNPVGLDRGQLGESALLWIRRVGPRVLFELPNLGYRALSDDADERRAVDESFARSVIHAAEIMAEDPDGSCLIDLTPFLLRDAHDVGATLARSGQGDYGLDAARSLPVFEQCLAFADNLEFESILTFAGNKPGPLVRQTTPQPQLMSLVAHHSFIRLPEDGYRTRDFDARAGSFAVEFNDYATPLDAPLRKQWIVRHRLEKLDPSAARSKVKEPLVYYVDRGAPEAVREALIEGASWWADAFDAAGFVGAFRVELLPEGAHPLDVRYNMIQWVHRATRGWSYGGGIVDPRTGEMLKGHVSLGSLRVRQDRMIFEAMLGRDATGSGAPEDPVQLALARIRQLAAHEVGHTLGLTHNFAASSYGDRESVMDYPAPRLALTDDGAWDVSGCYGVGIGEWDKAAIDFAYAEFADPSSEAEGLQAILHGMRTAGLRFLTEGDARPAGTAIPTSSLWDNGTDATAELRSVIRLRAKALAEFGEHNLAEGQQLSLLQELFVLAYAYPRFQMEAAAKAIGGADYDYVARGDAPSALRWIDASTQRDALAALLETLSPSYLDIDERVLGLLLPRPFGHPAHEELFASSTVPLFDPMGAAETSARWTLEQLCHPARCARLVDQHRRDESLPSLDEIFAAVRKLTSRQAADSPRHARLREICQRLFADALVGLAADAAVVPHVRALAEAELEKLLASLPVGVRDPVAAAHLGALRRDIARFLDARQWSGDSLHRPAALPPGSPIGSAPNVDELLRNLGCLAGWGL
jgi:hypothetical protein